MESVDLGIFIELLNKALTTPKTTGVLEVTRSSQNVKRFATAVPKCHP